jgi:hypothetical protein
MTTRMSAAAVHGVGLVVVKNPVFTELTSETGIPAEAGARSLCGTDCARKWAPGAVTA